MKQPTLHDAVAALILKRIASDPYYDLGLNDRFFPAPTTWLTKITLLAALPIDRRAEAATEILPTEHRREIENRVYNGRWRPSNSSWTTRLLTKLCRATMLPSLYALAVPGIGIALCPFVGLIFYPLALPLYAAWLYSSYRDGKPGAPKVLENLPINKI